MKKLIMTISILLSLTTLANAQKIMSPASEAVLRDMIPELEDKTDNYILHEDDSTIFYTIMEMPRAFQFAGQNGQSRTSFHWSGHNFSGDNDPTFHSSLRPDGEDGNANVIFPWRADTPGGTNRCKGVKSFKAFWLPKKNDGSPWPIAIYHQTLPNPISGSGYDPAYGWIFPLGTIFYEIITQPGPDGFDYVFEIRKRERELDAWGVDIYRPFPTSQSLAEAIKSEPDWDSNESLKNLVSHLESDNTLITVQVVDDHNRDKQAFEVVAGVDVIPPIDNQNLATKLLTQTKFKSALGQEWKKQDGLPSAFAPSYEENSLHIVPKGYDGTFLGTDRIGCMKCHESTNVHARVFDRGRGWYGFVSGSDGIISWHPSAPGAIHRNGEMRHSVMFRKEFVDNHIIETYSQDKHPDSMYKIIPNLK